MVTIARTDDGNALFIDLEFPLSPDDTGQIVEQVQQEVESTN